MGNLGAELDYAFFVPLGGILELQFVLFGIEIRGIVVKLLKDQGVGSRAMSGEKKKRVGTDKNRENDTDLNMIVSRDHQKYP